jgi:hypothetical protein
MKNILLYAKCSAFNAQLDYPEVAWRLLFSRVVSYFLPLGSLYHAFHRIVAAVYRRNGWDKREYAMSTNAQPYRFPLLVYDVSTPI